MANYRITIPEPCHEGWENMQPEEKGRFCQSCCKVVVDFTQMETQEILNYIHERKGEKLCGHFRKEQVVAPPKFVQTATLKPNFVQVFLAAVLLAFGSFLFVGCKEDEPEKRQLLGEICVDDSMYHPKQNVIDSPVKDSVVPQQRIQNNSQHLNGNVQCIPSPNVTIDSLDDKIDGMMIVVPDEE
jgi:hypothetical protein